MIVHGDVQHGLLIARAAHTGFDPQVDRVISRVSEDSGFLGGFIMTGYTGSMMMNHMAGIGGHWCSPLLMWVIFDYQFNQLGLSKVMASISSLHSVSLNQCLRAGFEHEHTILGGVPNGDMFLLSMSKDTCKWLSLRDRFMRLNGSHRGEPVHAHA